MKPRWFGNAGVAPFRTTISSSPSWVSRQAKLVVVVHQLQLAAAQDLDRLARHPLAAGVRVAAGQLHEVPVVVAERLLQRQQQLGLRHTLAPLRALPHRQEARGDGVAEAARPEVHADPDRVALVDEHVHVVVAGADGAQLLPRLAAQRPPMLGGHRVPRRILEERVVGRGVVRAVLPADAEADLGLDLVRDGVQPAAALLLAATQVVQHEVGADRRVAARDVEADAHHRHLIAVRGHAADRHHVAQMPIRHQRRPLRATRNVAQLRQRLLVVLAEDPHVRSLPLLDPARGGRSVPRGSGSDPGSNFRTTMSNAS